MSNIKATRNKEGVVEIGIEESGYHFIDFSDDGKYLFIKKWQEVEFEKILISNLEYYNPNEPIYFQWGNVPVKRIFIRNESKITGQKVEKYVPSPGELLEMGFVPIEKQFSSYTFKKVIGIEQSINYTMSNNNLWHQFNPSIPFHTKEDFMRCIGAYDKDKVRKHIEEAEEFVRPAYEPTITYIPSEKVLQELGFEVCRDGMKIQLNNFRSIWWLKKEKEFVDTNGVNLFIHSDSELKMLVDILGRESK